MNRILIVRLSAIGDIVMASGLPGLLRKKWPAARISWLCQPEYAALLEDHPCIDEVLLWPRREWRTLWRERRWGSLWHQVFRFRRELQRRQFDLALDLQGLFKSASLTRLSGARRRLGLGRAEGSWLWMHQSWPRNLGATEHISSEYRYFAAQLGLAAEDFRLRVPVGDAARSAARQILQQRGIGAAYLIACPFTTRAQKHWFADAWCRFAEMAEKRWGLPVLVLGGPDDRDAARNLCSGTSMISLAGDTSLQEAVALIHASGGVVGVDTGLTHIGVAAGVPTVALFGSTRPYLYTDSDCSKVIYLDKICAPCRRNPICDGRFECMREIDAEQVVRELVQLRGES